MSYALAGSSVKKPRNTGSWCCPRLYISTNMWPGLENREALDAGEELGRRTSRVT